MERTKMILSEFIRVMDLNWVNIFWGFFWFFVIFGTYTFMITRASFISGRQAFILKELPEMYGHKLKNAKVEIKGLREENRQLMHKLNNKDDIIRIVRKAVEG